MPVDHWRNEVADRGGRVDRVLDGVAHPCGAVERLASIEPLHLADGYHVYGLDAIEQLISLE